MPGYLEPINQQQQNTDNEMLYYIYLYLYAFWQKKYWVVISIIGMTFLSVLVVFLMPQIYTGTSAIVISKIQLPGISDNEKMGDLAEDFSGIKAYILSYTALQKIAEDSGMITSNTKSSIIQGTLASLKKTLLITQIENTVIELSYSDSSKERISRVLSIVDNLIVQQLSLKHKTSIDSILNVVSAEMKNRSNKFQTALKNIDDFQKQHPKISTDFENVYFKRIQDILTTVGDKTAQEKAAVAEKEAIEHSFITLNPKVSAVERSIIENDLRLERMRLIYTEENPAVKAAISLGKALQEQRIKLYQKNKSLDAQTLSELWAMASTDNIGKDNFGNNQILNQQLQKYQDLQLKIIALDRELANLESQKIDLDNKLREFNGSRGTVIQYEQDLKDSKTAYEDILVKYNQLKIASHYFDNQKDPYIKVIASSSKYFDQSSKSKTMILFLGPMSGLFLGLGLIVLFELQNKTAHNRILIRSMTGAEVICHIEKLSNQA